MLENFILGSEALLRNLSVHLNILVHHPFFWGFGIGFFIAAILSTLVVVQNPIDVCRIILHRDPVKSFDKITDKNEKGVYQKSFDEFQIIHAYIRFVLMSSILVFLLLIFIVALTLT